MGGRVAPIMLIFNPVILFHNSCHPSLLFLLHAPITPIIPVIFFQINFLMKYTHNNLFTDIYRTILLVTVILNRSSPSLEVVVAEVATWLVPAHASDSIPPLIIAHYMRSVHYYACILTYYIECENVSHVLWECSAYSSTRASFMKKLQELLEDDYEDFESLENVEKSSYVLGSELWESKFDGLLALVKEYIVDVWEIRKHKLYDSDSGSGLQLHTQSSLGERSGKFSQNGKFGQNGMSGQKGKVHLGPNVSSSAHYRGCVVNGSGAMTAI